MNNEKIEVSLKVIENMVKLHTQFWNKDLKKMFPLFANKSKKAVNNITGERIINKNSDTQKSPKGFIK